MLVKVATIVLKKYMILYKKKCYDIINKKIQLYKN